MTTETLRPTNLEGIYYVEKGMKTCKRPGKPHRTMKGPHGIFCPGCGRCCLLPKGASAGVLIKVMREPKQGKKNGRSSKRR